MPHATQMEWQSLLQLVMLNHRIAAYSNTHMLLQWLKFPLFTAENLVTISASIGWLHIRAGCRAISTAEGAAEP